MTCYPEYVKFTVSEGGYIGGYLEGLYFNSVEVFQIAKGLKPDGGVGI
jgi:hypothetical protein